MGQKKKACSFCKCSAVVVATVLFITQYSEA